MYAQWLGSLVRDFSEAPFPPALPKMKQEKKIDLKVQGKIFLDTSFVWTGVTIHLRE